jgi:hypothetical protein
MNILPGSRVSWGQVGSTNLAANVLVQLAPKPDRLPIPPAIRILEVGGPGTTTTTTLPAALTKLEVTLCRGLVLTVSWHGIYEW